MDVAFDGTEFVSSTTSYLQRCSRIINAGAHLPRDGVASSLAFARSNPEVIIMSNRAAWLKRPKAQLEVDDAPRAVAGPGEIVIKNVFVAINPVDWKVQTYGPPSHHYPSILGQDIAGEVVEVGSGVTRVRLGDRVIAHGIGRATQIDKYSAFQLYSVAFEIAVSPIPDSLPYEQAVVLPLAISTAASGLHQKQFLALPYPTTEPKPSGRTILIWGGSSSVGSTAIQLAIASGLEVVTTASTRNFALVKALGAKHVLDYAEEAVVDDIVALLKGSDFVGGFDAISTSETLNASADIVHRLGGGKLAKVLPGEPESGYDDVELGQGIYEHLSSSLVDVSVLTVQFVTVSASNIFLKEKIVGEAVWGKYVPAALASGKLLAKPDPLILSGGLPRVQEALDTLKAGVSATKVVVEL